MREHAGHTYEDQAAAGLFDSPEFDQEEIARAAAPSSESTLRVVLRDYQDSALDMTRQAIKEGARAILICAPTGGGKTVCGAALVEASQRKGSRSTFVVDRLSLINQTSETMFRYGLEHGVIQADHPMFRPSLQTQVCSVQTLARRKWPESQLDIIDEAHVLHQTVKRRIESKAAITIGLTATPFTKGLGKYFDRIINVTTTNNLIRDGWLVPYRILECQAPDMEGVKVTSAGEWDSAEAEKRALQVVGDVVAEYIKHGEERKFICSAVDTAHVDELQRQFVAAGVNVATYTYKDSDEDRADVVSEFRRPESIIRGLITVTAASRGFDVADIGCVIMARPLRKSHAEHIQLFGRGLRISPATGKADCLVLDHSGNCRRFWNDTQDFFENGWSELDDGKRKKATAQEKKPIEPVKCPQCRHMHKPAPSCPNCGHQYPRKQAIEHVPGTMKELIATGNRVAISRALWPQVVGYARERRGDGGEKLALALYKQMTGDWPTTKWANTPPAEVSMEVRRKITSLNIAWAKGRSKAAA